MANFCSFEIHARGNKKAVLCFYNMINAYCDTYLDKQEGTHNDYVMWMSGSCKWSLDAYSNSKDDVAIDLDSYSEEEIRKQNIGEEHHNITMAEKSKVLGLEILAHSWSEESEFDLFEHFMNGEILSSESADFTYFTPYIEVKDDYDSYEDYLEDMGATPNQAPPLWNKNEYESYKDFCEAYGIDIKRIREYDWYEVEDEEDVYHCWDEAYEYVSPFTFEF